MYSVELSYNKYFKILNLTFAAVKMDATSSGNLVEF